MQRTRLPLAALIVLAATTVASAHPGHDAGGFVSGVTHPVTGLDHVLAMVGVGVIAASMRRAWVWALPTLFVLAMTAGAALGAGGLFVPSWMAEAGVALSVVLFGGLMAAGARVPPFVVVPLTALFAVCHGSVHAAEMPAGASVATFFVGFVAATTLLHVVGIGVGVTLARQPQRVILRTGGVAMSVCGALMLAGFL